MRRPTDTAHYANEGHLENIIRSKSSLVHYCSSLLSSKEKLLSTDTHNTDRLAVQHVILPCDKFCCTKELWWEHKLER